MLASAKEGYIAHCCYHAPSTLMVKQLLQVSLTEIATRLYYQGAMSLPTLVQQIIDQVIEATPDLTPELRQPLQDELQEQFDQLLSQTIIDNLPPEKAESFEHLLATKPQPNPEEIRQFLTSQHINTDAMIQQAADRLKSQYMEES